MMTNPPGEGRGGCLVGFCGASSALGEGGEHAKQGEHEARQGHRQGQLLIVSFVPGDQGGGDAAVEKRSVLARGRGAGGGVVGAIGMIAAGKCAVLPTWGS